MRLARKTVTKVLRALEDARPKFASLVKHGANETPFTEVKSAEIDTEDKECYKKSEEIMKLKHVLKEAEQQEELELAIKGASVVHKLVFDNGVFDSEDAVKSYADEKYEDYTITKSDSGYEIVNKAAEEFSETREIKLNDKGVTAVVGYPVEDGLSSKSEEDEKANKNSGKGKYKKSTKKSVKKESELVTTLKSLKDNKLIKKSEEVVQKLDMFDAYYEGGKTLAETLDAANDGMPIGIHEINTLFYYTLKNILMEDSPDMSEIDSLVVEFGNVIKALAMITMDSSVSKAQKEIIVSEKKKEELEILSEKDEEGKTEESVEDNAAEEETTEGATQEGGEGSAEESGGEATTDEGEGESSQKSESELANLTAKFDEKLTGIQTEFKSQLDDVKKTIDDKDQVIKNAGEELEKAKADLAASQKRVEELEKIASPSKGLAEEDLSKEKAGESKEAKKSAEDKAYDRKVAKDVLGF
jgi:hypothetical protein